MPGTSSSPELDGTRLAADLEHLAAIGADPRGGVTRLAYSRADLAAREWVESVLVELGLAARRDEAGNTIARLPGGDPSLPPLAIGSHTDTVPNGGRYDGALGVVAAIACARALRAAGVRLRHPLEIIDFAAEEATMGGGTFGSRAMAGILSPELVTQSAWDGRPVADHLRQAGLDPQRLADAARGRGSLGAYLELHVEQGAILEREGVPIGLVEGIVGIRRYAGTFSGQVNHAGTTPMALRRDALVNASRFVVGLGEAVTAAGIVGTVGVLRVHPGAPNVIPGLVELEAEMRGLDEAVLDRLESELGALAGRLGGELQRASAKAPSRSDPGLLAALESACRQLGLRWLRLPSGAGHDAMCAGELGPQAMVFVPSRGGVSHSPDEFTEPERCVDGARVLLRALLELDRQEMG